MDQWFQTPPGQYLLDWERARYAQAVADVFGYHALQLGLPVLNTLASNRMPHRWLAMPLASSDGTPLTTPSLLPALQPALQPALITDFAALPFAENSLDLVTLPHSLELGADPHASLREVARVLVPDGRAIITGLNPASLWGLRQRRAKLWRSLGWGELYLPDMGEFIAYRRLRDWLRLLDFEVEASQFGCYRPAVRSAQWLERTAWADGLGPRWWPILGATYSIVAVKRVRGMRLISAPKKLAKFAANAPVAIARKQDAMRFNNENS